MNNNKQSVLYLTPKSTYYNSEAEVIKHSEQIHAELFKEDRELYTYLLFFLNSTYFSKSLIIKNLLKNSLYKSQFADCLIENNDLLSVEDGLIQHALFNENITHALKLLLHIKKSRINNNRTTKVILNFIFNRGNADFISIKYKSKIKDLLIHALGLKSVKEVLNQTSDGKKKFKKLIQVYKNPYAMEVFQFVFDNEDFTYTSEYLKEYVRIRSLFKTKQISYQEKTTLPVEVLIGFNNYYKTNIPVPNLIFSGNVSDKQKIQLQNTVKRHTNNVVEIKLDLNKYSIIDLFKYAYNKQDITVDEVVEIKQIIDKKSKELKSHLDDSIYNLEETAILVDCSDSNFGSEQSKNHPLFKNLALASIFKWEDEKNVFYIGGEPDKNGLIRPMGDTNLSKELLNAVQGGFKNIIVLSDGFENVGSFEKVFKQLRKIGYDLNAIHFNPVFSPKNYSFKEISEDVFTLPFTNEQDVENLFLFYLLNTDKNKFKQLMKEKVTQLLKL